MSTQTLIILVPIILFGITGLINAGILYQKANNIQRELSEHKNWAGAESRSQWASINASERKFGGRISRIEGRLNGPSAGEEGGA